MEGITERIDGYGQAIDVLYALWSAERMVADPLTMSDDLARAMRVAAIVLRNHGKFHPSAKRLSAAHYHGKDGDSWWSVVDEDGDIATGVMHITRQEAERELQQLLS